MKWEYKVIEDHIVTKRTTEEMIKETGIDGRLTIDKLNELGDRGWELSYYAGFEVGDRPIAIFKREKS